MPHTPVLSADPWKPITPNSRDSAGGDGTFGRVNGDLVPRRTLGEALVHEVPA